MTDQELLRLCRLKGTIQGLMAIAKCELRANHKVRPNWPAQSSQRWLDGRDELSVRNLQNLNQLRRELCQIIKEAKG